MPVLHGPAPLRNRVRDGDDREEPEDRTRRDGHGVRLGGERADDDRGDERGQGATKGVPRGVGETARTAFERRRSLVGDYIALGLPRRAR